MTAIVARDHLLGLLRSDPEVCSKPSIPREVIAISEFAQNLLIAALPDETHRRWMPRLERMEMDPGAVLYEPKEASKYVYFPATATISLLYVLESGASAEVAVVGCEGMV